MISRPNLVLLLLSALAALIVSYFTYPPNGYVTLANLGWMAEPLSYIELPSAFIGGLASGNMHQPDPSITFVVLFLTYLAIVGALILCASHLRRYWKGRG